MIAFLRRAALDVVTVACLIGLAVVVTVWVRSYSRHDALTSYFDDPPPPNWLAMPMEKRAGWRERVVSLLPGRIAYASVSTKVVERQLGPVARLNRSDLRHRNGWMFGPAEWRDWPESCPPPPGEAWNGFGGWRFGVTQDLQVAKPDYREVRRVEGWSVAVPDWAAALVLAVVPASQGVLGIRRWRKGGRRGAVAASAVRLLGRAAAALSLLLLIAVVALWMRSYRIGHLLEVRSVARNDQYHSILGVVAVQRLLFPRNPDAPAGQPERVMWGLSYRPPRRAFFPRGAPSRPWLDWTGVRFSTSPIPGGPTELAVHVPHASLAALFALLPTAGVAITAARRLRRRRRFAAGHCQSCGYDLRGGHERCPECGAAVTPAVVDVKGREVLA